MNIYTITRHWNTTSYNEYVAHVVIAADEQEVRRLAAKIAADEGEGPWFDHQRSQVTLIGTAHYDVGGGGVVLSNFNAA